MPNTGIKETFVGLTPGSNYKVYALLYSEDGIGQPALTVYDETNAAVIATITGTVTSTEWVPDRLAIAFKLPTVALGAAADCVSVSIKLLSATAGNYGIHKCEWHPSLIDDGGYELNVAVTDIGTPTTSDRNNTQIHSGSWSHRIVTDAIGEGFSHAPATTVGKFYRATAWVYSAANSVVIGSGVTLHNGATTGVTSTAGASWKRVSFVFRAVAVNTTIGFISTAAVQTFYVDDFSVGVLDDVLLTITPASQANSLEGTGIRADGYDLLSTPTAGEMAYNWWYAEVFITPRHSDATVGLFGIATPCWIEFRYNAANTLLLDWSAANTLRLRVITGGVTYTGTWATGGGAVLAGTKYLIKIEQYYGEYRVYVGGIQRITIPGVPAFPFVPNIAYWGMDNARAYNSDIVVSSY